MDKKSDAPMILAPGTASGATSMHLPAEHEWPPLDEHLDPPEVTRWERLGGDRIEAHSRVDLLLGGHLAEDYVGSTDLKTRVSEDSDYASDTCVRKEGTDPRTGERYLEELVFEVVSKRSLKDTDRRARGFAERGVRRQIGIFVEKGEVCEWSSSSGGWKLLDPRRSLRDPCLAHPLPISALLESAQAEIAVARALEAKGNPAIAEMKAQSASEGEARGEARGRAVALLTVLTTRGLEIADDVRGQVLATTDLVTLDGWLRRAGTATSLEEVFGATVADDAS